MEKVKDAKTTAMDSNTEDARNKKAKKKKHTKFGTLLDDFLRALWGPCVDVLRRLFATSCGHCRATASGNPWGTHADCPRIVEGGGRLDPSDLEPPDAASDEDVFGYDELAMDKNKHENETKKVIKSHLKSFPMQTLKLVFMDTSAREFDVLVHELGRMTKQKMI